jgi:hypothetical protein
MFRVRINHIYASYTNFANPWKWNISDSNEMESSGKAPRFYISKIFQKVRSYQYRKRTKDFLSMLTYFSHCKNSLKVSRGNLQR